MSLFDEQPDADPHGESAAEIHRLQALNDDLITACIEGIGTLKAFLQFLRHQGGQDDAVANLLKYYGSISLALAKASPEDAGDLALDFATMKAGS